MHARRAIVYGEVTRNDGQWYAETLAELVQNPGCIGFHLCGAYQRNRARRYGLIDEAEQPDMEWEYPDTILIRHDDYYAA